MNETDQTVGPGLSADDELELVGRAGRGDWDAFATLVDRLQPRVHRLAWRIVRQREDAEDVTQQTFISVAEHIDQFRGDARFSTWVLRIATNFALKVLRRRRNDRTVSLEQPIGDGDDYSTMPHPDFIAQWQDNPATLAQRSEIRHLLRETLDELDAKYSLVFILRDIEGFSTRETAEALGITAANVKVRLLRARLQLRERLTRRLGDEAKRLYPSHDHD